MVLDPETVKSPWSTPTESEICEAEKSALSQETAFNELGLKVTESLGKKLKSKRKNMPSVKETPKKVPLASPKKRKSLRGGSIPNENDDTKQKKLGQEKVNGAHSDKNESNDSTNGNHVTDITIPNVIPPPPRDVSENKKNSNGINGNYNEGADVNESLDTNDIAGRLASKDLNEEDRGSFESSTVKHGSKTNKLSEKKSPKKIKGNLKAVAKQRRSNSPEKSINKVKDQKEASSGEKYFGTPERIASPTSRTSGDSLKLGADYTNINGDFESTTGSIHVEKNNINCDEKRQNGGVDRKASPTKQKNKTNSTSRRKSLIDNSPPAGFPNRSNSPKKINKGLKADVKNKTKHIALAGEEDEGANKWSSEKEALEKWQTLSNYAEMTSEDQNGAHQNGHKENQTKSNSEEEDQENTELTKKRKSKMQKVSPKESPKKSPLKSPKKVPSSPKKSPTKSPRKKLKDILQLPFPYDEITSGKLRVWENAATRGEKVDEDKYPEYDTIRQAG